MGTNFYAILPIKQETKDKFYKLVKNISSNNIDDIKWDLYDLQEELDTYKIHLGKRSYGWSFLWDLNELEYYEPTLNSIKNFIENNKAIIKNEYGEEFTWDQFINKEIGDSMTVHTTTKVINGVSQPHKYDCFKTYYESHPNESNKTYMTSENFKMIDKLKGYEGTLDERFPEYFNKDGMRFALFTQFS